jgi:hypothetical protein
LQEIPSGNLWVRSTVWSDLSWVIVVETFSHLSVVFELAFPLKTSGK